MDFGETINMSNGFSWIKPVVQGSVYGFVLFQLLEAADDLLFVAVGGVFLQGFICG